MHIHILGICGTFMGSLALLARDQGIRVTGCDHNVYPPMSTQLEEAGIELTQGFDADQLGSGADLYVIGNAMSRGNDLVEAILNRGLPYTSGPQFLADHVLPGRWVLAVAGTHGKTTTTSMLAWILEYAGYQPGFLIGGVARNFETSACLGQSDFFIVEADEYDSAFFDKRSKFLHYRPRTLVINNLEFDHADIFADLAAIQRQFHHLVRTVPSEGSIFYPLASDAIRETLEWGCWSNQVSLGLGETGSDWSIEALSAGADHLRVHPAGGDSADFHWQHGGEHNMANALAAVAAAHSVGVPLEVSTQALSQFAGVKRRMEVIARRGDTTLYDDFAHHPTAIRTTLEGLRRKFPQASIFAIVEPRSNTMKMGVHQSELAASVEAADRVFWYQPENIGWNVADLCRSQDSCHDSIESLESAVLQAVNKSTQLVIMSNGGFGGLRERLAAALERADD